MAREIITKVWCDPCMAGDVHTEAGEGVVITIAPQIKPRALDLCEAHMKEFVEPLKRLLDEFGAVVDAPKSKQQLSASPKGPQHEQTMLNLQQNGVRKGRTPAGGRLNECLWCPLTYSGDGGGFGRHLRVAHGFAGFTEAFGGLCPVCGEGHFDMMGAHVSRAHEDMGFQSATAPFTWARDNGDPHGVYAAKLQQVGSLNAEEEWEKTRELEREGMKQRANKKV